jgi:hypothetical protein
MKQKKFEDEPLTPREIEILQKTAFEIARRKDKRAEGNITSRVDSMLDGMNDD